MAVYTMSGHTMDSINFERDIGVKVHKSLRPSLQCSEDRRTKYNLVQTFKINNQGV